MESLAEWEILKDIPGYTMILKSVLKQQIQNLVRYMYIRLYTCIVKKHNFEPSHEIMVLFVLRKLILQTCMRSHPVGLEV